MSEPFVGEIRMFAGNFAPRAWAFCNGTLLAISQNQALFSLLGTNYGGDGRTTFGLPDLRGRVPMHQGQGPGLTPRFLGQKFGAETVTLTPDQLPSHTHVPEASSDQASADAPQDKVLAKGDAAPPGRIYTTDPPAVDMSPAAIANSGASQAHDNTMPFQCVNFIVALQGIYPSRN
jgi:microcystin-dependent protein